MTFDGRHPLAEDNLWQKATLDRRHPFTEDDLWQKTTFDERRPLTEDDLWQKTTFDGRRHSLEDDLWQKTTFVDENLWEKTTKSGRRTLAEDDLLQKTTLAHTPHHIPLCGIFSQDLSLGKAVKNEQRNIVFAKQSDELIKGRLRGEEFLCFGNEASRDRYVGRLVSNHKF